MFTARDQPIDASGWIIPEAVLNLDLAVSGLIRNTTKHVSLCTPVPRISLQNSKSTRKVITADTIDIAIQLVAIQVLYGWTTHE